MLEPATILRHLTEKPFKPFRVVKRDGTSRSIHDPKWIRLTMQEMMIFQPSAQLPYPCCDSYETISWEQMDRIDSLNEAEAT